MGVEKLRGIVLKDFPSGETGTHILVLTQERGKVLLSAKGARKPKSKLLAGTQPFCYGDFFVYEGRGFGSVTQVDVVESFFGLRNDYNRLTEAVYLLDLVERTCMEGAEQTQEVLSLLLRTLWMMDKKEFPPVLAARIFELKYLQISGVMPMMDCCAICSAEQSGSYLFSPSAGGMVCQNHSRGRYDVIPLSAGVQRAMKFVFEHDDMGMFGFQVSAEVLQELEQALDGYIKEHLHVSLKSREFFKV